MFALILMSEVFRAKIRFSEISFSYNIAYAISGGITPQLVFWLIHSRVKMKIHFIWYEYI